ncbi:MAG: beta-galactosidase, partial [Flavisolibacter sp.]|nr:beta-galactosidase [Flavisolibacter sp.]
MVLEKRIADGLFLGLIITVVVNFLPTFAMAQQGRQKISINDNWRFIKGDPADAHDLSYDVRPRVTNRNDDVMADTRATESVTVTSSDKVLKKWILPSANDFIKDPAKHHQRPDGNPGGTVSFVQNNFNDNAWEQINLPHDWAIEGPFYEGDNPEVGGGMGRLPSHGVAWYRRKLNIPSADKSKFIYL